MERKPIVVRKPIITAKKTTYTPAIRRACPFIEGVSEAKKYAGIVCSACSFRVVAFSTDPDKLYFDTDQQVLNAFTYPEGTDLKVERDNYVSNFCSHIDDHPECKFYRKVSKP